MKSSSESMLGLPAVRGVGGLAAEAIFFFGRDSNLTEDIAASAAFLFFDLGGMVPARERGCGKHAMTDHTGKAAGTGFTRDDSDKTTGRSKKGVRSVTGVLKWINVLGRSLALLESHGNLKCGIQPQKERYGFTVARGIAINR
jgi:hypothetical protein